MFSRVRTRTNSMIDERIDNLRPTLGILRSGPAVERRPRSQTFDYYPTQQPKSRNHSTGSFCNVPEHKSSFFIYLFFWELNIVSCRCTYLSTNCSSCAASSKRSNISSTTFNYWRLTNWAASSYQ